MLSKKSEPQLFKLKTKLALNVYENECYHEDLVPISYLVIISIYLVNLTFYVFNPILANVPIL